MTKQFKPMLAVAAPDDWSELQFPLYISPKIDGIRALIVEDGLGGAKVVSRSLKNIPNKHVQATFGRKELIGFDGELVVGSVTAPNVFNKTTSGVMSVEGEPEVTFYLFDYWNRLCNFATANHAMIKLAPLGCVWPLLSGPPPAIVTVEQVLIQNADELEKYHTHNLNRGFEGSMLRSVGSPYKFGRSTQNEGYLLKLKVWEDAEAEIIGFEAREQNNNEKTINELGNSNRSSHKANKVALDTLGNFLVRDIVTGVEFSCPGSTDELCKEVWGNQDKYLGMTLKYKHIPHGKKDKPRHPIFVGFRSADDLGE